MSRPVLLAFIVLSLLNFASSSQPYSPAHAQELIILSSISYCNYTTINDWSCPPCQRISNQQIDFLYYFDAECSDGDKVAFSFYADNVNHWFVVAFPGTNSTVQLLKEVIDGDDTEYSMYDVSDGMVNDYFYNRYKNYVRGNLIQAFPNISSHYSGWPVVFTGHSLGGALAMLGALDLVLGGQLSPSNIMLYSYGQPRVGNYALAQKIQSVIPTIYRIVHWQDIVPHLSPCHTSSGNCVPDSSDSTYTEAEYLWPAYHAGPQIFYTEDFSNYQECSAESPSCANQFDDVDYSIEDHLHYWGRTGCHPQSDDSDNDFFLRARLL